MNFLNNLKVKFSDVLLIFWAKDGFFFQWNLDVVPNSRLLEEM